MLRRCLQHFGEDKRERTNDFPPNYGGRRVTAIETTQTNSESVQGDPAPQQKTKEHSRGSRVTWYGYWITTRRKTQNIARPLKRKATFPQGKGLRAGGAAVTKWGAGHSHRPRIQQQQTTGTRRGGYVKLTHTDNLML